MKHKIHLFIFCYDNDFLQKSVHSCRHNLQALKGLVSCGFIFFLAFSPKHSFEIYNFLKYYHAWYKRKHFFYGC